LSQENKRLERLLEDLNINIEILTKVTALTFRKDSLFKGKETKQEQIEALENLKLPDNIIALITCSTTESVQALRSMRKAKTKKVLKAELEKGEAQVFKAEPEKEEAQSEQ
jgi:hypothetical protein